jgi:hypothetical protein
MLDAVFSMRFVSYQILSLQRLVPGDCLVEAGSNTSIVALQVVGGDEKEPSALGYNWATIFLGDINTGSWPSRLGEPRI